MGLNGRHRLQFPALARGESLATVDFPGMCGNQPWSKPTLKSPCQEIRRNLGLLGRHGPQVWIVQTCVEEGEHGDWRA